MPIIQNVAYYDVVIGNHLTTKNAVLIQIVDPDMDFPTPLKSAMFHRIHFVKFLDLDDRSDSPYKVSDVQAANLVWMLQWALDEGRDVVVHCVAGVCRSGAVTEVGVMMGFQDANRPRIPNVLVKQKMMRALGWTY